MTRNMNRKIAGSSGHRQGFTVVELLVVIAIIGVLAALITPAVFNAITRAKQARVTMEIANISSALERWKVEFGDYPPDFTDMDLSQSNPVKIDGNVIISDHIARKFRYRNAAMDIPVDQQGNPLDLNLIDPSEALFFWLGGSAPATNPNGTDLPNPHRGGLTTGVPAAPVTGAGDRQPFFDFDPSRLTDNDNDGFLEYHPPGVTLPYIYYRANPSSHVWTDVTAYQIPTVWADGNSVILPYVSSEFTAPDPDSNNANNPPQLPTYVEPKRFQIISAGLDDMYGRGGNGSTGGGYPFKAPVDVGFPSGPYPKADRDNITNFSDGTLEDAAP